MQKLPRAGGVAIASAPQQRKPKFAAARSGRADPGERPEKRV